jgi:hypothetical protein
MFLDQRRRYRPDDDAGQRAEQQRGGQRGDERRAHGAAQRAAT